MPPKTSETLRTPLFDRHVALRARMVPFAGWDMPLQYASGILAEHQAVRTTCGMFDVSHMGRLTFQGPSAAAALDRLVTSDVAGLEDGQARYGFICLENGGILDDVIALREDSETVLLVCNAANRPPVKDWARGHSRPDVEIADRTEATVMIAIQGPEARGRVGGLLGPLPGPLPTLKRFYGSHVLWLGEDLLVTRTGYTGEDGVEIICASEIGQRLWDALVKAGVTPCGLGARDTLRLEAGLPLHGQDIDTTTNPIEAGLERFVHFAGGDFIGKAALQAAKTQGVSRTLAGFRTERGAVARHGQAILEGPVEVGHVTSGNFAPSLGVNIGMGYVPPRLASPGQRLSADVRGKTVDLDVCPMPFYRRQAL